jgi:hypothetical protein
MNIDEEDFLQAPRIQKLKAQITQSQDEAQRQAFLKSLINEIISRLSTATLGGIEDDIAISNLDEVSASITNNITRLKASLTSLFTDLKVSADEQNKILTQILQKSEAQAKSNFQPLYMKKYRDEVSIKNFQDIIFPEDCKINNLSDLKAYFDSVVKAIEAKDLTVEAPKVTVQPTPVNIPEVIIPPVDLAPVEKAISDLAKSLKKIKDNNKSNPLAVRLSDGGDWIEQLVKAQKETAKQVAAFAGGSDRVMIRDINGNIVNPSAMSIPSGVGDGTTSVSSAGTRVQLSATSVPCRYVIITAKSANTNNIYVGGATVDSTRGRPLVALQSEKIDIDNLNKVWLDADTNGEGVLYAYVS